jgi:hypothetical protein
MERYYCPPFFSAHLSSADHSEEQVVVEDLSLRGMKARTSCDFEKGCNVRIKLVTDYSAPVRIHGRVKWSVPPENEGSSYLIGLAITKVRIVDWLRFIKIIGQIKREVW